MSVSLLPGSEASRRTHSSWTFPIGSLRQPGGAGKDPFVATLGLLSMLIAIAVVGFAFYGFRERRFLPSFDFDRTALEFVARCR